MTKTLALLINLSCLIAMAPAQEPAAFVAPIWTSAFNQRLADGQRTRIVCFGDSITGAYYHTGSQRAWCDMLGLALQKSNPNANLQMINAGLSGHTTVNALARIDKDVIAKKPDLVVIMFGMNDVTRVPLETYQQNMREIIMRCRNAGAAVVLCTPNGVSPNAERPEKKLDQYAGVVRSIAKEFSLPMVDFLKDWQALRSQDPIGWSLLMSDAIHPNMNGHKRFAELIAESICGRAVSLDDPVPPLDVLHHSFDRLNGNEVVKVIAMPPYDQLVPNELKRHFPDAKFEVTVWPTENHTVSEMTEWAKRIRGLQPDLVIPAVPLKSLETQQESFIADYEWALNWSFQFSGRPWDVIPIMPLESGDITDLQLQNLANARATARGKDILFVDRAAGDQWTADDIVSSWIKDRKREWQGTRGILPTANDTVRIPVQSWPNRPGPRSVRVSLHYPGGQLKNVDKRTGIMLTLHNWGGEDCAGTANPDTLAEQLNVIAVCVNYLQSGRKDSVESLEPYDFGYLQALDALRALAYVRSGLNQSQTSYDDGRIFCTGGSGGGNVTLMANKLAPRTFACVIDMCGMKRLSDDIAFDLPGGSDLNARWSRETQQAGNYLSSDAQAIRDTGNPTHLETMKSLLTSSKIVIVHGEDDQTCPFSDAQKLVVNLQAANLDVEANFIGKDDIDGSVFTSTGHPLGNRTKIVLQVAGKYLRTESPQALVRSGPTDFDRREDVRYRTEHGQFVISYADGIPTGRFIPNQSD